IGLKKQMQVMSSPKLSNQCRNRYKIYAEGFAWSVSFKYILSCDSPVLVVTPEYYDFFTRGLMPGENYLPVRHTNFAHPLNLLLTGVTAILQ
ncbi:hypothetical protein KI387_014948, partial [Taxus chinensis]